MAKSNKQTEQTEEKKVKIEFSEGEMSEIKTNLRTSLNALEDKQITSLCKTHKVDVKKYSHLSGGLLRMNLINSLIGVAARGLRSGEFTRSNLKKAFA